MHFPFWVQTGRVRAPIFVSEWGVSEWGRGLERAEPRACKHTAESKGLCGRRDRRHPAGTALLQGPRGPDCGRHQHRGQLHLPRDRLRRPHQRGPRGWRGQHQGKEPHAPCGRLAGGRTAGQGGATGTFAPLPALPFAHRLTPASSSPW